MAYYTFETDDENVSKVFEVQLSFSDYDKCIAGDGPIHPETNQVCKTWRRIIDQISFSFANPQTTSKFDNFGYRADFNLEKAKAERRAAEALSHVGSNPYFDQEGINLEKHDMEKYEGKIV